MDEMTDEQLDRMAWDQYASAALSALLPGFGIAEASSQRRDDLEKDRIESAVGTAARIADAMMTQRRAIWD